MATDNDLHTLFEARCEEFEIVDGQPTYADLHSIVEELPKLIYPIQFDKEGGIHNLIGLIMNKANYTNRFDAPFPRPKRPAIYDESIENGATGVIHANSKAIHRGRITDWDAFEAAEREAKIFLIDEFDKAWYHNLCKTFTFNAQVKTRKMLEHLQGICVSNHAIYILDLQDKMQVMHTEHDSIAQYIRALEEAQQQATRAGTPITDATLVMISTKGMLATQRFPTKNEKWEELGRSAQTWVKWKDLYKKPEKQAKVKRQATGRQDQFGGAVLGAGVGGAAPPGGR